MYHGNCYISIIGSGDLGAARTPTNHLRGEQNPHISANTAKIILEYSKVDQFTELIEGLKSNPMGTKKTVTFWNPAEREQCALTPCHWSFEILVEPITIHTDNMYDNVLWFRS